MIKLAERELMAPLDEEARRLVSAAAQRVSVVTAVSPRALIDVLFVFVAWVTARRGYLTSIGSGRRSWILALFAVLLFGLHVRLFVRDIGRGGACLTDMGRPSICAGEWLRQGLNPWAQCVQRPRARGPVTDTWSWCVAGGECIGRE